MKINTFLNARLGRKHYLFGILFFGTIVYLLVAFPIIFSTKDTPFAQGIAHLVFSPFLLILINRRCHDMGTSGKYYFAFAVANIVFSFLSLGVLDSTLTFFISLLFGLMGFGIGIMLLTTPGEEFENKYGVPTSHLTFFQALFPKKIVNEKESTYSEAVHSIGSRPHMENKHTTNYTPPRQISISKILLVFTALVSLLAITGSIFYYLVIRPMDRDNALGRCLEKVEIKYSRSTQRYKQFHRDNCFSQFAN